MNHSTSTPAIGPDHKLPASSGPMAQHTRQQNRWLLAALGLLLLLLALLAYFVQDRHRQALADAASETRNLVELVESHLSSDFARVDGLLGYIARRTSEADLRAPRPGATNPAIQQRLADLQASFPMVTGLSVFDALGALRYASDPSLKGISIADRPHFQRLRDDPNIQVLFSEAQIARTTGQWSIVMVRTLRDDSGHFLGTVNAVIGLEGIGTVLGKVDVGAGGGVLLRSSETFKLVLRRPRHNEQDVNQPLPKNNAIRQRIEAGERAGTLSFTASTDGVERLASFRVMDAYPFYVQVGLAKTDYLAAWRQDAAAVAGLATVLLLGFVLAYLRWQKNADVLAVAAHRLAESETNLRTFYNSINDFVFVLDMQGNILYTNEYVPARLHYPADELIAQSVLMVHPPERREEAMRIVAAMLAGTATHCLVPLQTKDGELIPAETRVVSGRWNGQPALFGLSRDITERKQAEHALAQQSQRLTNILWGTGVGTWEWNVQTGETRFNARWAELIGYTLDELAPVSIATWMKYAHPDDLAASGIALQQHFAGETDHYECECRMLHKSGHWIWVLDRGKLVSRSADGQPEWMAGTHWDINERKLAEQAMRANEAFLQEVLDSMPNQIAVIDLSGSILAVNEAWLHFSRQNSQRPEQLAPGTNVGSNYLKVCSGLGGDALAAGEGIQAVLDGRLPGFGLEYPCHSPQEQRWFSMSVSPLIAGKKGAVVAHLDITQRKLAEQALRANEAFLQQVLNSMPNQVTVIDQSGSILTVNEAWRQFSRQNSQQPGQLASGTDVGANYLKVCSGLGGDAQAAGEGIQAVLDGRLPDFGLEYPCHSPQEQRWFAMSVSPLTVGRKGAVVAHRDITQRKQSEQALQQRTEALARSNTELEQFAYVASHDLRQPLRMVNSYLQLIERALAGQLEDDTRKMMHFATEGAKRMDQMLVSLLEYSRVGRKGEPLALLDSREPVDEALHFLAPAIQEARATVRLSGDWPQMVASRDELTRLWQNLIGNAVKYRAPDRAPMIDITVMPEGDSWRFCVTDNGIGIDPAQFDRLFKVFQRLHARDQYEGSGIGLAVARKIVQRHGGRIWVESAGAGQGCRFCFDLPAREPDAQVSP